MVAPKKKDDPMATIKTKLPEAAPWVMLGMNIVAGLLVLVGSYKKQVDEAFMTPYTHVHYTDKDGHYVCGGIYISKKHICDGRFLNVVAEVPTLDTFLKLGLTKEQWDSTRKIIKQFQCEGPHA